MGGGVAVVGGGDKGVCAIVTVILDDMKPALRDGR